MFDGPNDWNLHNHMIEPRMKFVYAANQSVINAVSASDVCVSKWCVRVCQMTAVSANHFFLFTIEKKIKKEEREKKLMIAKLLAI